MQHLVQNRRDFYNRVKLLSKADYKIIDIRIDSKNSYEYRKDNHSNRNERKNKTKGTGRGTFPHSVFRKVRKRQIKHLPEARKNLFQIDLLESHIYIIVR